MKEVCSHCSTDIKEIEEYFYIGCWDPGKQKSSVLHFHPACFKEIAGSDYIQQIKSHPNNVDWVTITNDNMFTVTKESLKKIFGDAIKRSFK